MELPCGVAGAFVELKVISRAGNTRIEYHEHNVDVSAPDTFTPTTEGRWINDANSLSNELRKAMIATMQMFGSRAVEPSQKHDLMLELACRLLDQFCLWLRDNECKLKTQQWNTFLLSESWNLEAH